MLRLLRSLLATPRHRPSPGPRRLRSFRPAVEELEGRIVPSSTSAIADGSGQEHLFALGQDRNVYELDLTDIGIPTSGYHRVTSGQVKDFHVTRDGGLGMHLFAVGLDDQVYQVRFDAHGRAIDGYTLTQPGSVESMVADDSGDGKPQIFVKGLDDQVYFLSVTEDGSVETSNTPGYTLVTPGRIHSITLGSIGSGDPASDTSLAVFVIGLDNQVYESLDAVVEHKDGSVQDVYQPYSLVAPGQVRSVSAHLFALGLDNQVYDVQLDFRGQPMGGYQLTSPRPVGSILAQPDLASGNPAVFAVGTDHQVYTLELTANGGTAGASTASFQRVAPGQVQAIAFGRGFDTNTSQTRNSSILAVGGDDQIYEATSAGLAFATYSPYFLVAPGQVVP
jgi:hypothetical protein